MNADVPFRVPDHVPVAVQTRGAIIESVHFGSIAVVDPKGSKILAVGEPEAPCYPRSALKPLQAVAMLRNGLELDGTLLALAASSHSGSAEHVAGVRQILRTYGISADLLRNPAELPYGSQELYDWLRLGGAADQLTQNCSGKHAAMLGTCSVNGWPMEGYLSVEHPLQQAVRTSIEQITGAKVGAASVDGCGTPVYAMSLTSMALAYGRIAAAECSSPEGKIAHAMRSFPETVSGIGRDVAAVMRAQPGLLAKDGAEGVQLFGLPDGRGVAVKISDGSPRARMPVAINALIHIGAARPELAALATTPVLGGGHPVGTVRALNFAGTQATK